MGITTSTQTENEERKRICNAIKMYLTYDKTKYVINHMFDDEKLIRQNVKAFRCAFFNAVCNWYPNFNAYYNMFYRFVNINLHEYEYIDSLHVILCNFPEYKQCELNNTLPINEDVIRVNSLPAYNTPKYERWILCAFLTPTNVKQIILQSFETYINPRNHLRVFMLDCLHRQNKYTYFGNFYDVLCAFLKRQTRAMYGDIHNAFSMFATYRDFIQQKKVIQMYCFLLVCEDCYENYDHAQIPHRLLVDDIIVRAICRYKN
jgi:hypothetical protein